MKQVVFPQDSLAKLHEAAARDAAETCAVGLVHSATDATGRARYTVHGLRTAPAGAYIERSAARASLTPDFMLEIANHARAMSAGVILLHTHPGEQPLQGFSEIDDASERPLAGYFAARLPGRPHFAGVVTQSDVFMRELGGGPMAATIGLGKLVRRYGIGTLNDADERYDRQVRAFGLEGQSALRHACVALVGAGGTGSIIAQQLAHLGVGRLLVVDHDVVDMSNLNRLLGATPSDVGRPKALIAQRAVKAVNPNAQVEAIVGDVVDPAVAARLKEADFIFCCTDSMASRALINQFAYQYLIPSIDMGVAIRVVGGHVASVTGRVQMLAPGLGCLVCGDGLNGDQVRWEMMSAAQRRADPYFENASVPQPAVMPLNGVVTSAAVAMFLSAFTSYPGEARMLHYDGIRGSVRPQLMPCRHDCIVCGSEGAMARGSSWSLPVRHEQHHV
ncbi:MAG TPA: ThiF family adenylyltransferase [Ramlibacter sp.]|nr:ThiF family adenylyltransferase [Ramlibacter sp.]